MIIVLVAVRLSIQNGSSSGDAWSVTCLRSVTLSIIRLCPHLHRTGVPAPFFVPGDVAVEGWG
jgi:hypothetical protein